MLHDLLKYFDENNIKYFIPEGSKDTAFLAMSVKDGKFFCYLSVGEDDSVFFVSDFPINVTAENRSILLELINYINSKSFEGTYFIRPESGEIRLRSTLMYNSIHEKSETAKEMIEYNIVSMSTYFDIIQSVISRNFTLQEAMQNIDKIYEGLS